MHAAIDLDDVIQQVRPCLLELLGPLVRGRSVVLTGSVARNDVLATFLAEAGAREVHHIELNVEPKLPIHLRLLGIERLIANPASSVRRLLETSDPTGHAVVYAGSFTAQSSFCGRKIIGARQRAHVEAEHKDRQQEYISPQIRSEQCTVELSDSKEASETVLVWVRRAPTVVSGVPDTHLAMGGSHTYLVEKKQVEREGTGKLLDLIRTLSRDCRKAVLSVFDFGIPCTFYGYATHGWIVDFGPFEALVYWNLDSWQLWAPGIVRPLYLHDSQRGVASAAVDSVARSLREKTGYTGAFCTDGTIRSGQYLVHEINPRVCAGFSLLSELCADRIPFALIDLVLRERPAEANMSLRTPLSRLALVLQKQEPVVRLWDALLSPVQEKLRSQASRTKDTNSWLSEVRQSLAGENMVPLRIQTDADSFE